MTVEAENQPVSRDTDDIDMPYRQSRRSSTITLHDVDGGSRGLLSVRIDQHSTGVYVQPMVRRDEGGEYHVVYQVREMPDLGVYRDPFEAVRAALSVAVGAYCGDEG